MAKEVFRMTFVSPKGLLALGAFVVVAVAALFLFSVFSGGGKQHVEANAQIKTAEAQPAAPAPVKAAMPEGIAGAIRVAGASDGL